MTVQLPDFYDDLDLAHAEAWRLLTRAVVDRRSEMRVAALATIGLDGAPECRTVVLRRADKAARRLLVHTDARSAKAAEIAATPTGTLLFYDRGQKTQIRIRADFVLHVDGLADVQWAKSQPQSRECYQQSRPPSAIIDTPEAASFTPEENDAGRQNFLVIEANATRLDWLYLHRVGHRRARFDYSNGEPSSAWLAP